MNELTKALFDPMEVAVHFDDLTRHPLITVDVAFEALSGPIAFSLTVPQLSCLIDGLHDAQTAWDNDSQLRRELGSRTNPPA